ncbi:hypothetical protein [Pengzhenrongella sicca]|uniref:Uncharacterized protein n=1 Tax=Pengzhenrongella sicca TaxID=2819238 RepID=A0A8A4ZDQ7_9MICO|nr:hypothetical protein [Pengzhenrongella sicca]QTE30044.1 hypothetical protein J4E96_03195 [Pengzhenrongella sicca]
MNTFAALIVLNGYLYTARRVIHERVSAGDREAGNTLENVILVVGFVTLAIAAIAVITVAVNRRLNQIK